MTLSLDQWIEKIQLQHPADIELGLDRVLKVAKRLGLPQHNPQRKLIVIGGTNGKGTTAAILEALSVATAKTVFCYSSPHISCFNERIRINGNCIDDQSLIQSFESIDKISTDIKLTFFEFTTLAAMLIEAAAEVEIAIYEVGLGGRLDAVNILQPDVAMITSIALDHTEWLGDSLEQIGAEKIAIARSGKPLIFADECILEKTIQAAKSYTDEVFQLGSDFILRADNGQVEVCFDDTNISLNLPISVHPKNLAGACFSASKMGFDLTSLATQKALQNALKQLFLPGRFEQIQLAPMIFLDVSHNQQAILSLKHKINALKGPIKLICGMLSDKLNEAVLEPLKEQRHDWYLVTLSVPRGAQSDELEQLLVSEQTRSFENFELAINSALDDANGCGNIVIFGSFYLVEIAKRFFAETKHNNDTEIGV